MDSIDHLELYWRQEPPIAVLAAAFLDYKPPAPPKPVTPDAVTELLSMFPGGAITA